MHSKNSQASTTNIHVISPEAIHPIQELKTKYLGSKNPRLHTDETLIALSVSAADQPGST